MYRYRILAGMEVPLPTAIVAREALKVAARELNVKAPALFFIDEDRLLGTIQTDCRVNGIAEPARRLIYIDVDQPLNGIVRTVLHEVRHLYNGGNRELAVDAFVGRVWGSHTSKTRFVEIMTALEGIRAGAGAALDSNEPAEKKTDAEHHKLAEVRRRYYQEGIKARAEAFLTPRNRRHFPPGIEFHNTPIGRVVVTNHEEELR
jgi:hypothetical protein